VLRVLGNVLDIPGFAYDSSEQVRDELIPGNLEFVSGLDNTLTNVALAPAEKITGLQRVADVAIYGADSLVRRAPALQASVDARRSSVAYLNQSTLSALGLTNGNMVRVAQGQGSALVKAEEDNNLPDNCVRLAAGTATSALLGEMYGSISVERA